MRTYEVSLEGTWRRGSTTSHQLTQYGTMLKRAIHKLGGELDFTRDKAPYITDLTYSGQRYRVLRVKRTGTFMLTGLRVQAENQEAARQKAVKTLNQQMSRLFCHSPRLTIIDSAVRFIPKRELA